MTLSSARPPIITISFNGASTHVAVWNLRGGIPIISGPFDHCALDEVDELLVFMVTISTVLVSRFAEMEPPMKYALIPSEVAAIPYLFETLGGAIFDTLYHLVSS